MHPRVFRGIFGLLYQVAVKKVSSDTWPSLEFFAPHKRSNKKLDVYMIAIF